MSTLNIKVVTLTTGPFCGLRISGTVGSPIRISRVNPGSEASSLGIRDGDIVSSINGQSTESLSSSQVQQILQKNSPVQLGVRRSTSSSSGIKPQGFHELSSGPSTNKDNGNLSSVQLQPANSEQVVVVSKKSKKKFSSSLSKKKSKEKQQKAEESTAKLEETSPDPGVLPSSSLKTNGSSGNVPSYPQGATSKESPPEAIVWQPPSADPSPSSTRKTYKPIQFNAIDKTPPQTPTIPGLHRSRSTERPPSPPPKPPSAIESSPKISRSQSSDSYYRQLAQDHQPFPIQPEAPQSLPKYQSPTVTLLQKAREGQLPKGAHYLENSSTGGRRVDLPGPPPRESVPSAFRPGIGKDEDYHAWYKRMYESLHVEPKKPSRTGDYSLRSPTTSGYFSEPEEPTSYSYGSLDNYGTLDRRKLRYNYDPQPHSPSSTIRGIRFTPGKIADYQPGGPVKTKLGQSHPQQQQQPQHRHPPRTIHDLGYESDTNLIIRKRTIETPAAAAPGSPVPPPLSPAEQRHYYVGVQKGGEVPLQGLRKLPPEKPRTPSPNSIMNRDNQTQLPTNVSLLQSRLQAKLGRSNSDIITPRKRQSQITETPPQSRPSSSASMSSARQLIHTIRQSYMRKSSPVTSPTPSQPSQIPVRPGSNIPQKFSTSSPDLKSPREVKKVLDKEKEEKHTISIKVEIEKDKPTATTKKSGLKKANSTSSKTSGSKKVKIANGSSSPSKPPRSKSQQKIGKPTQTPVATRHAGCLSPQNQSRPTSPSSLSGSLSNLASNLRESLLGKQAKAKRLQQQQQQQKQRESGDGKESSQVVTGLVKPHSQPLNPKLDSLVTSQTTLISKPQRLRPPPPPYDDFDNSSYRSLPTLTPYLRETQRVSKSAFLTANSLPRLPPRPTITSLLRERLALGHAGPSLSRTTSLQSLPPRSGSGLLHKRAPPSSYSSYIHELKSPKKSERFQKLTNYYSSLEKLGELIRSTSVYDIPKYSLEKQLDFDNWWSLKNRLRIDSEISKLRNELLDAQKRKEFLYSVTQLPLPKKFELTDPGLRIKKWKIHELRDFLEDFYKWRALKYDGRPGELDIYKCSSWRGVGVKEVALNLEVAAMTKSKFEYYGADRGIAWLPLARRAFSMSSTLSTDEREFIKSRLGSLIKRTSAKKEDRGTSPTPPTPTRPATTTPHGHTTSSLPYTPEPPTKTAGGLLSESIKKQLSRTLSEEFREKKDQLYTKRTTFRDPYKMNTTQSLTPSKVPAYSVYSQKGVPDKVDYFEKRRPEIKEALRRPLSPFRSRSISPISVGSQPRKRTSTDEYMSHVNVISKLARLILSRDSSLRNLLQREVLENERLQRLRMSNAGEVERLKQYFEDGQSIESEINLLRCLFCSDPNLARLTPSHTRRCASADLFRKNSPDGRESSPQRLQSPDLFFSSRSRKPIYEPSSIPNVCTPTLTAHTYLESPALDYSSGDYWDTTPREQIMGSPVSLSPIPTAATNIPSTLPRMNTVKFKNFDPSMHRPKSRYVPPPEFSPPMAPLPLPYRTTYHTWTPTRRPVAGPVPPNTRGRRTRQDLWKPKYQYPQHLPSNHPLRFVETNENRTDLDSTNSPNPTFSSPSPKYAESNVNIHYKTPVRLPEKEYVSEDELRRRQIYGMKKFYEEQRRRKYLQEIQDMENRRHTDNFTPSQKSPIPLNRYDGDEFDDSRPNWIRMREQTRTPEPSRCQVARALYNFVAQSPRELNFQKGELIYIRRKLDSNWYEGEYNGAVGIFPTSYVELLPESFTTPGERATPKYAYEGQARVRFNFTAVSPVELSINKGDIVVLTKRIDGNWYEGRIGGRKGIFPSSYVQVLKEPQSQVPEFIHKPIGVPKAHSLVNNNTSNIQSFSPTPIMTNNGLTIDTRMGSEPAIYRAIYHYRPTHPDELELQENDIVHVLEKCDDGWFVGTSGRTGLFGTFPGNYVERV